MGRGAGRHAYAFASVVLRACGGHGVVCEAPWVGAHTEKSGGNRVQHSWAQLNRDQWTMI